MSAAMNSHPSGPGKVCLPHNAKDKLPGAWLVSRDDGSQWNRFDWRDTINEAVAAAKLPTETKAAPQAKAVLKAGSLKG